MSAVGTFRQRGAELLTLRSQFAELLRQERRLLALSGSMLAIEIVFLVLAPWPIKYLFDGLLDPEGKTLWGVPAGFTDEKPYIFLACVCGSLLFFAAMAGLCGYYRQVWAATAGQRMVFKLRKRLYSHLHRLSLRFHRDNRLGDLLVRITGDIPMLRDVLSESFIDLIGRLVLVLAYLGILIFMDPILGLVAVGVLILVGSLSTLFGGRIVKVARKQREMEGILAYTAGETLSAMALVKAYGREDEVVRRFARKNRSSMRKGLKGTKLQASLSRWVELTFAVGVALVLAVGVVRCLNEGGITSGDLLVLLAYMRSLNKPLRKMSRMSGRIGKATACGERILEILAIEPEEKNLPEATAAPALRGEIHFDQLQFSYDGTTTALEGVDLKIEAGERVGIVGRNGAGKSTLMHLLLRFYEPTEGVIRLDGRDSRSFTLESVRDQISMALQSTYLFGSSIRDNIHFAAPDVSDEEMLATLESVGGRFVRDLPEGLDTELAEGGENFSGGECRKIALAGALLRKAPILVLDEPTSYIDRASRSDILEELPRVTADCTTLVITHDPEMLGWLDRVIYLEEGRIAGCGEHRELQQSSMGYRALFPEGSAFDARGES